MEKVVLALPEDKRFGQKKIFLTLAIKANFGYNKRVTYMQAAETVKGVLSYE